MRWQCLGRARSNNTFERTAGSHALAAAAQRERWTASEEAVAG